MFYKDKMQCQHYTTRTTTSLGLIIYLHPSIDNAEPADKGLARQQTIVLTKGVLLGQYSVIPNNSQGASEVISNNASDFASSFSLWSWKQAARKINKKANWYILVYSNLMVFIPMKEAPEWGDQWNYNFLSQTGKQTAQRQDTPEVMPWIHVRYR